jgi:multidrug efflux system outer membrane protein
LLLLGTALFAGCTLAPKYERPAAPVAAAWPTGTNQAASASATVSAVPAPRAHVPEIGWRAFFTDPRLQALIALSLKNNRDLRTAVLKVDQSRAQYRIQQSALFPSIDASGGLLKERLPADVSTTGHAMTTAQYSATAGVTAYEVDLFGRVQSLRNEALEEYLATDEARLSTQISLIAEVATQYLTELGLQEQRELAVRTLASVTASSDLTAVRFKAGTASDLDLRTAQAEVQSATASVASYDRQVQQAHNALVLLVGEALPGNLPAPETHLDQDAPASLSPALLAALPSDLLESRPDIREAEHALKAANADIGAARAAFFPAIELTASGGTTSAKLSGLFKPGSSTWTFEPQITLPIFAGGKNLANLDVAKAERQIQVAAYEKAIQTAFREVSDALVALRPLNAQITAEQAQVGAERERQRLTELRYQNGSDSYLAVLLAEQDLYSAQQGLISTQVVRLTNYVTLYKALGGGVQEYGSPRS